MFLSWRISFVFIHDNVDGREGGREGCICCESVGWGWCALVVVVFKKESAANSRERKNRRRGGRVVREK